MPRGRPRIADDKRERRCVTIRLNDEDYSLLLQLQAQKKLKFTDLIRQAIRIYANKEDVKE